MSITQEMAESIISDPTIRDKRGALVYIGLRSPELEQYLNRATPYVRTHRARRVNLPTIDVITAQPTEMITDGALRYAFGVEIECGVSHSLFAQKASELGFTNFEVQGYNHIDSENTFKFVTDGSVYIPNSIECVSPILQPNNGLERLKLLCSVLSASEAKANRTCGLHVHIDARNMSAKHYLRVFTNYKAIEKIIDSFMSYSRRENNNNYCMSLCRVDYSLANNENSITRVVQAIDYKHNHSRYYKVNQQAYLRHKSVEFRQHQGTVEYEKIANWITFLQLFVAFSESNTIEEGSVTTIDDLPFLTTELKEYYKQRKMQLNG